MAIYFDDIQGDVASIFLSYFQRAPEFEAMQHYVGVLQALQANPETAGNAFNLLAAHIYADGVASQEVPAGPTVTDSWYVSYLYSNVLGRAPDAEGLAYWVAELQAGNIARAELVGTFVAAALASEGRDAAYLNNRTEVAVEFAQWENSNPQVLPTLKYNAAEVLLGVNEDPATVAIAESRLETTTGVVGVTRNLTTNIDTIEGTTGNDTFNAVFEGKGIAGDSTLTAFDSIDGDLGTDTFNIYVSSAGANAAFPSTATVRNVEIVNVYNGGNAADLYDPTWDPSGVTEAEYLLNAANYQGVQQLWQIGSESNVINVGADTAVGFRNITEEQMWADVTLATGVSTATIALDNVGSATYDLPDLEVDGDALSTVNVVGALNAGADHLDLAVWAGKGVRALTVNTAVDTHLFVAASGPTALINSLDLSGSTGDVLFEIIGDQAEELVGAGSALTVSLGAGDDTIVFGDRALSLRDSIDGGEGHDTLALAATGRVQTQTYDAIARTTNFESVAFFNGSLLEVGEDDFSPSDLLKMVEVDAAQLEGFDSIIFAGVGVFQVSNLSSDVTLEVTDIDDLFPMGVMAVVLDDAAADVNVVVNNAVTALLVGGDNLSYLGINELEEFLGFEGSIVPGAKGDTGGTLTLASEESFEEFPNIAAFTNIGGKFSTISTDEFDGIFVLAGMSAAVAETVALGADTMAAIYVIVGETNSSTLGLTDVIEGFTLDATVGGEEVIGDRIVTDDDIVVNASAKNYSNLGSLQEALEAAAQEFVTPPMARADVADLLVFVYGDDTYIFGDTVNPGGGAYDNGDFLLKLAGVTDAAAVIGQIVPFDGIGGLGDFGDLAPR